MAAKELDWCKLLCTTRMKDRHDSPETMNTGIGRQELERDYDRILFSAPTRRLADKTQVFPMEKHDSVRTRLTHSHEVSNLARSIGVRLAFDHRCDVFRDAPDDLIIERAVPALLATIGLAHDLGNPPFGHQGEHTICQWFEKKVTADEDFLKFDGNCQTFRLLTRLQILNDKFGLNLTYATLAGLMKYPVFHSSNGHSFKKFGVFISEKDIAKDVWTATGLSEGIRHPLAYVTEACDDIAYSVIDAEDTVKKGYASFYDLMDHLSSDNGLSDRITKDVVEKAHAKNTEFKHERLSSHELNDLSMLMFRVKAIAEMVQSATKTFVDHVRRMMSGDISSSFELIDSSDCARLCTHLKEFDKRHGFLHPEVLRLELEGHNYITQILDMLWEGINHHDEKPFAKYAYGRISENYRRVYEDSNREYSDKAHLLCDTVSGMSESYLVSLHNELRTLNHAINC